MKSGIWYKFLEKLNQNRQAQGQHLALITDNTLIYPPLEKPPIDYTRLMPPVFDNITLLYLSPNTTAWLQSLDVWNWMTKGDL